MLCRQSLRFEVEETTVKPCEPCRVSRIPHCLGGWGLWDVQVGFPRRCASVPSGRSRSTGRPHASKGAVLQSVAPKLGCTAETLRTEDIRPCTPQGELGVRHGHTRSTSARHRIRHGIRHTAALVGRRPCRCVANGRLRHMLIGYARVSKADGSQSLDRQRDALRATGVDAGHVYHDFASGVRDDRPGLDSCVRALRTGDVLVVQGRHLPIVEQDRPSGSRLRAASPDSGAAAERLGGGRAVRADAPVWALLLARGSRPRHRMTTSPSRSRRCRTAPATLARVHHRVADARMAPHRGRQRAAV